MSKLNQDIRTKTLILHNEFRSAHNVAPLQWSSELEKSATDYATQLAFRNQPLAANTELRHGQNLFELKSRGAKFGANGEDKVDALERAIRSWYKGSEDFRFGEGRPGSSTNGLSFSQMVWKSTKEVGLGVAQNSDNDRIVIIALYSPPGNFQGEFANNVFQRTTTNIRSTSSLNNTDKYNNSNTSTLNSNSNTLNSNTNTSKNRTTNLFNNTNTNTNNSNNSNSNLNNDSNTSSNYYTTKTVKTTTTERNNSDARSNTLDSRFNDDTNMNTNKNTSNDVHTTTKVLKNWNLNDPQTVKEDTNTADNENTTRSEYHVTKTTTTTTSYTTNNQTDNMDEFTNTRDNTRDIPVNIPITNVPSDIFDSRINNRSDIHNINRNTNTTKTTDYNTNTNTNTNTNQHNLFDSKINRNVTSTLTKDTTNYTNSRILNQDQNNQQHTVKFQLDSPTDYVPGSGSSPGVALELHNKYRRKHGVAPLRLDQKLCEAATEDAKMLLDDKLGRSPPKIPGVGRNIYKLSGSGVGKDGEEAVVKAIEKWYSHANDYNFSSPLQSQGHSGLFSQVVWKNSEAVGVGIASSPAKPGKPATTVVVCLYSPGGNIVSEQSHRENVFPASR